MARTQGLAGGIHTEKGGEKPMLEKEIEQALCQAVRDRGGMAIKMTSPGTAGLPDRLILLPNGNMAFVEPSGSFAWSALKSARYWWWRPCGLPGEPGRRRSPNGIT